MKRRLLLLFFIILSVSFWEVYWENVFISSVLPNTTDDTTEEYIELTNYSNNIVSLSWFSLKDKSWKTFIFTNQILNSQESKKFYRPETMILLNNTDEELYLYDNNSTQIDYFSYTTSTKNVPIITWHISNEQSQNWNQNNDSWVNNNLIIPHIISSWSIANISYSSAELIWISFTWITSINVSWWAWELNFSWATNNSNFKFDNLTENTAYNYRLDLLSETWVILDFATWGFLTSWISIEATELYYSDTNNNSKVDLLEIKFNQNIKWSIDYEKIKIYSNSWWLAHRTINSETWIICNYSINDNFLKLFLNEQDNIKSDLIIDNSTTSDLRLKSLDWLWITSLWWIPIPNFSLTSSFDNYWNVFKNTQNSGWVTEIDNWTTNTWIINQSSSGSNSWDNLIQLVIPDIVISFQQPSYIIESETWSWEYFCDKTKTECKINFNLLNSFSWSYNENNYRCEINIWTWWIINTCNPDTIIFPYSTYNISFRIIDKNNPNNYKEKIIILYNIYEELEIPNPVIRIQSWLDNNNYCTKSSCSINPTAEDSFLMLKNSKYACSWNFVWGSYNIEDSSKCNPSYIHYPYWDHIIKLRIYEVWNTNNFKETTFSFRNNIIENYSWLNYMNEENKKIKAIITIQWKLNWKTKKQIWNKITCIWLEKCSVNFSWEDSFSLDSQKLWFEWNFGNWERSTLKNPSAIDYWSWTYQAKLRVTDSKWNQDEAFFIVEVIDKDYKDRLLEIEEQKYKNISSQTYKSDIEDYLIAKFITTKKSIKNKKEPDDFNSVFWDILSETNDEIGFSKIFDKIITDSIKEEDEITNYSISLQWNIWKNLSINNWVIVCQWRKNCKINLSLSGSKLDWYKYVWSYPNWQEIIWTNPKSTIFNFWTYIVWLKILDKDGKTVFTKNITIISKPIPKKLKNKTSLNKKIKPNPIFNIVLNNKINSSLWDISLFQTNNLQLVLTLLILIFSVLWFSVLFNKYNSNIFSHL